MADTGRTEPLPALKDTGKRQRFATGAVRDVSVGKGRFDLLPPYAIFRIARHFEAGAVKYGDSNWRKGIPLSRYLDSAERHLNKLKCGMDDEDHAAAAAWNILCFIETKKAIEEGILPQELDDITERQELMPKKW